MNPINRRTFLGAATLGAVAAPAVLRGAEDTRIIKLGLIGAGWYGNVDVEAAFKAGGVEVAGICDADSEHLRESAAKIGKRQGKEPKTFKQYQDLLAMPELEVVIIATPPHWHALPFLAALERNLDIYCEKPLAYDIREGRAMVEAARNKNRIVQIGFQRRQSEAIRQARQFIQDGGIGNVVQVEAQIHYNAKPLEAKPQDPPASLDWEQWCGPAPKLPYCPQIGHKAWRLEKEYGNGHLVDWGIHLMDATRWILGETTPRTITAAGGIYYLKNQITTPDVLTAHFEFARCPVTWRHKIWGASEYTPETENGIFLYGDKSAVFATDNRWVEIPLDRKAEKKIVEVKSDAGPRHMADFLACVRSRKQPVCLPEDAFYSTATVQLGMISYQAGAKISWDGKNEEIIGHPSAAKLLRREYRPPYAHPGRA